MVRRLSSCHYTSRDMSQSWELEEGKREKEAGGNKNVCKPLRRRGLSGIRLFLARQISSNSKYYYHYYYQLAIQECYSTYIESWQSSSLYCAANC